MLNVNHTLSDIAKQQAGTRYDERFEVNEFNYNVSIVAELIKTKLEEIDFFGLSVHSIINYLRDNNINQCFKLHNVQGDIHFDKNGIRNVTELRLLQYRTTFVNSTPIMSYSDHSKPKQLRLVDIAVVRNKSIEFLTGDKKDIWPSKPKFTSTAITYM